MIKYSPWLILLATLISSCGEKKTNERLPFLGRKNIIERKDGAKTFYDTIPHKIADFRFLNQDSLWVSNETFQNKIYVADFFFTSCPTICPIMKTQMLRVYNKYSENQKFGILSHTIDPKHDSVSVLKSFAEKLDINTIIWQFVTGNEDAIYELGETSYMVVAGEDEEAAGGYIHSGAFLLIDMNRHVRGVYDGTEVEQVDILINDIENLLKEYDEQNTN
jgi:protein SCO1/2